MTISNNEPTQNANVLSKDERTFLSSCGVQPLWFDKRVEDFQNCDIAKRTILKFLANPKPMLKEGVGFYVFGSNGVGKNHLANAAMISLMKQGITGFKVIPFNSLVSLYTSAWTSSKSKEEFSSVVASKILLISGLGKEYQTVKEGNQNFSHTCLDSVIKLRLIRKRPTWVTSNIEPSQIKDIYTPDIASMLKESCVPLFVDGSDYRNTLLKHNKDKWL